MLSAKLRALASLLHQRPDLTTAAITRIEALAEDAAQMENASIAPQVLAAGILPLPANVVRLPVRVRS